MILYSPYSHVYRRGFFFSAVWSEWEETARLEEFFSQPRVALQGVHNPNLKITMPYQSANQWQLTIDFPPFVANEIIGLQVTRSEKQAAGQMYMTAPKLKQLNEQSGRFELIDQDKKQLVRYTLNCGGSTDDTIAIAMQMLLGWLNKHDPDGKVQTIAYLCKGNTSGAQTVKPQHEFGQAIDPVKMAILVEV